MTTTAATSRHRVPGRPVKSPLAELGLDGRLRPVPGALPAILAGAAADMDTAVVATANLTEAGLVPGAGKTMLAERIPSILPDLEPEAALEGSACPGTPAPKASAPGHSRRPPDNPRVNNFPPAWPPTTATPAPRMPLHRTSDYLPLNSVLAAVSHG
jgi:hypothetical protein